MVAWRPVSDGARTGFRRADRAGDGGSGRAGGTGMVRAGSGPDRRRDNGAGEPRRRRRPTGRRPVYFLLPFPFLPPFARPVPFPAGFAADFAVAPGRSAPTAYGEQTKTVSPIFTLIPP